MTTSQFSASQLRDLADAKEAHERGEPVEIGFTPPAAPKWGTWTGNDFTEGFLYRPAPAPPQPVPWSKPEHIKVGAVFQKGEQPERIIVGHGDHGILIGRASYIGFNCVDSTCRWRWPHESEWRKCEVML